MKEIRGKQESRDRASKTLQLIWSENQVWKAVVEAKSKRDAERKWHRGDPDVWDCPKDLGGEIVFGSLEIREMKTGED